MYIYIFGILFIIIVLFLVYKFYPKINAFIQKYIIPSQQVKQIKQKMRDLEENEMKNKHEKSKIMENINEILYLPIDFLHKLIIINGTSLLYKFSNFS